MEVISEELVPMSRARKILEDKAKEEELGYEQNNALEYLKKFSKLSLKKSEELLKELGKIAKLKDRHKVNIINFLPEDAEDLRILFSNEVVRLTEDDKKAILSAVKKHL